MRKPIWPLVQSVWSVNNAIFSLKALVIVSILVGISTYLLVFNLNNVVEFCSRVYSKRKLLLIELMQKDLDKEWKETGQKFTSFQPKQEKRKPSEWMLVLFVFYKVFSRFQFTKGLSEKEKQKKMRSNREGSMPYWPDLPLPEEPAQATNLSKVQSTGESEVRKKSSTRGRFARLSIMFRRGAFSPGTTANVWISESLSTTDRNVSTSDLIENFYNAQTLMDATQEVINAMLTVCRCMRLGWKLGSFGIEFSTHKLQPCLTWCGLIMCKFAPETEPISQ